MPLCIALYAAGQYAAIGSPELAPAGAGGSSLVQVAPICWQRISAAGPGRLSAKLSTRTPRRAWNVVDAVETRVCFCYVNKSYLRMFSGR